MDYKIYNKEVIESVAEQKQLEKKISLYANNLTRYFKRYDYPVELECYVKKDNKRWKITLKIPLRERTVVAEAKDFKLLQALKSAYVTLKREIKKAKELERKDYLYKRKNRVRKKLSDLVYELAAVRSDEKEFKKKLDASLHEINEYTFRRIEQELQGTLQEKDKHKLSREFYDRIYNNFPAEQLSPKDFNVWIYKQAEDFVNAKLNDKNLSVAKDAAETDEFLKYEIDRFVSVDNQSDETINKEDKELAEVMSEALRGLSTKERAVLELSMNENLETEEVSKILGISEEKVKAVIDKVSGRINSSI